MDAAKYRFGPPESDSCWAVIAVGMTVPFVGNAKLLSWLRLRFVLFASGSCSAGTANKIYR